MLQDAPRGVDPKAAAGAERLPLATLPWAVIMELAAAHGEGAQKYGRHNWRTSGGVVSSTYFAAALRHLLRWWEGEDIDPDSGLPHIVKAMASLGVLRDAQICGQATDDRPGGTPAGHFTDTSAAWSALLQRS